MVMPIPKQKHHSSPGVPEFPKVVGEFKCLLLWNQMPLCNFEVNARFISDQIR